MARPSSFTNTLRAVDPARLRAAFEASGTADSKGGYDRTTLNRWLDGALPNRAEFVRLLADELDEPNLFEAWHEARGERSGSSAKSVVSRFEGLSRAERDEAFHEIRKHYVSADRPVWTNFSYRITVNDPAESETDHLLLRVDFSWEGRLPAQASVAFVNDPASLGNAYGQPNCIFREILDFDSERMTQIFDGLDEDQVLAYNLLGLANPQPVRHRAKVDGAGNAQFDNDEVERARIRLSLSYPAPKGNSMFFLKIGEYSIPGPAEVTLVLNAQQASRPRAFPFLAPGRQREWASNQLRSNELFVTLGTAETVLGEGDGVVLFWTLA